MPEELQTEVCDILQEAVIKTILKKNQCKNATWFSKDALQIDEKRIEAESEGERENYSHFKLEFQSIGRSGGNDAKAEIPVLWPPHAKS